MNRRRARTPKEQGEKARKDASAMKEESVAKENRDW